MCQISSLNKIWATIEGGPDNHGATLCSQPNSRMLHGWVLAEKDVTGEALKNPVDYAPVWTRKSLQIKQEGIGYISLPTSPDGYKALGHVVTNSPEKPFLEKVRCVRSELTN